MFTSNDFEFQPITKSTYSNMNAFGMIDVLINSTNKFITFTSISSYITELYNKP